jgi:hypothetical protein
MQKPRAVEKRLKHSVTKNFQKIKNFRNFGLRGSEVTASEDQQTGAKTATAAWLPL